MDVTGMPMHDYNLRWHEQSRHSGESMPLGGHSIGCNVWVENSELLLYFQQSGCFDENGSMLKGGRFRVAFDPDPFTGGFLQELVLEEGTSASRAGTTGAQAVILLWVDVRLPVIHIDLSAEYDLTLRLQYETWRDEDRRVDNQSYELFQCKEVWGDPDRPVIFHKDQVEVTGPEELLFYHRNLDDDLSFDREMDTQGLREHKADPVQSAAGPDDGRPAEGARHALLRDSPGHVHRHGLPGVRIRIGCAVGAAKHHDLPAHRAGQHARGMARATWTQLSEAATRAGRPRSTTPARGGGSTGNGASSASARTKRGQSDPLWQDRPQLPAVSLPVGLQLRGRLADQV